MVDMIILRTVKGKKLAASQLEEKQICLQECQIREHLPLMV